MSRKSAAHSSKRKNAAHKSPAARRPADLSWILWCVGIVVLTFVVYVPSLDNDFITNWDDAHYVTQNPYLPSPDFMGILTFDLLGNYHPLTVWSLVLNYQLSKFDPISYHWLNLLLHLANTILVFLFVRRLTGGRLWTTVACSLFFGIHPMHVESVAWVAERKDVLYAFFFLIGLIVYSRYLDKRHLAWLLVTLAAFVLALASKPAAVVFPVVLLLLDWYKKRPLKPVIVLEKIPFFLLSLGMGLLTVGAQQAAGAMDAHWSIFHRVVFACFGGLMYIVKLFLPFNLSAIYPYPNFFGKGPGPEFYIAFAVALLLIPVAVVACRRSRTIAFALGFYLINIILVLQFATVGQAVMADRYTYLPYIGIFIALAWWLDDAPSARRGPKWVRPLIAGFLVLLLPVSVYQTWRRCEVWQNPETLWTDTIEKFPHRIYGAYASRGDYRREYMKRLDLARADLDEAIALNPNVAIAWNDKGMVFVDQAQFDSALVCFDRAIQIKPDLGPARSNRGAIFLSRGDGAAAVKDFTAAIETNPRFFSAFTNRALAYSQLGEHQKAIDDLRAALVLEPGNEKNHLIVNAAGLELMALNRPREAVADFDRAMQLAPAGPTPRREYLLNRSRAWWALGDRPRALADAEEARRLGAEIDPAYLRTIGG